MTAKTTKYGTIRHVLRVIHEVKTERVRQIDEEGWSAEHDDEHRAGELAVAATVYARYAADAGTHRAGLRYAQAERAPADWPWAVKWWKPKNPRRDLIRAAALIVAEIERLDRLSLGRLVPHHGSGPDNI